MLAKSFKQTLLVCGLVFLCVNKCQSLEPLKPFNWATFIEMPPVHITTKGAQILHFKTVDKPYAASEEAVEFVQRHFKNAQELKSDADTLRFASDSVTVDGAFIELGVSPGRSINVIAALNPSTTIYGFDTFEGSPEDWVRLDKTLKKGTFKFKNRATVPPTLQNVTLFKGRYRDVLPEFIAEYLKEQPIALLHIDSDTYGSAKEGLDAFSKNIVLGTIIVFDEYYNFPGSVDHEYRALKEFMDANNYTAEYLAFNGQHEQVVIKVASK